MSSDSSIATNTSSRIRQFGLYRTIDARTEEFLKLSRKRQIRQGCACAVISTAITVAIVVCVILVYEYEINAAFKNKKKSLHRTSCLNLRNDTANNYQDKFRKTTVKFDKSTIKLLPLIIKALKHNKYLENLIEDSSNPIKDEIKATTEMSIATNLFSNRKWIRIPTSKLYTIEYKTSPIVYLKYPTRNIDYYTKIRKIRDYNRIMNYLEKMISEKGGIDYTKPMRRDYISSTEKITSKSKSYTDYKNQEQSKPKLRKQLRKMQFKNNSQQLSDSNIVNCKCPKNMGNLLNKLIFSIHQLLNDDKSNRMTIATPCDGNKLQSPNLFPTLPSSFTRDVTTTKIKITTTTTKIRELSKKTITEQSTKRAFKYMSEFDNVLQNISTKVMENHTYFPRKSSNISPKYYTDTKNFTTISENNMNTNMPYDYSTTAKSYIDGTEYYDEVTTTVPMLMNDNNGEKIYKSDSFIINNYALPIKPEKVVKTNRIYPKPKFYKIFGLSTDKLDTKEKLDMNDKITGYNQNESPLKIRPSIPIYTEDDYYKHDASAQNVIEDINVKELIKIRNVPKIIIQKTKTTSTILPILSNPKISLSIELKEKHIPSSENRNDKIYVNAKVPADIYTVTQAYKSTKEQPKHLKKSSLNVVEEGYGIDDDFITDDTMVTSITPVLNKNTSVLIEIENKPDIESNLWESLKSEENSLKSQSMLPQNRPTYLEIQRNYWKHDEPIDYDTNMKYNSFD